MQAEPFDKLRTAPFDKLRTAPFDKLRTALVEARDVAIRQAQGPSAGTQLAYRAGEHRVQLGIADWYSTEEEPPVLAIAYHDEDHVVT